MYGQLPDGSLAACSPDKFNLNGCPVSPFSSSERRGAAVVVAAAVAALAAVAGAVAVAGVVVCVAVAAAAVAVLPSCTGTA